MDERFRLWRAEQTDNDEEVIEFSEPPEEQIATELEFQHMDAEVFMQIFVKTLTGEFFIAALWERLVVGLLPPWYRRWNFD